MTKDDALARAAFALAQYTASTRRISRTAGNIGKTCVKIERENREAAQVLGVLAEYEADVAILTS